MEEDTESAWETKWESENKFKQFLQNGLKIPNFHAVAVADVHRLPQHPITKDGQRITRPIIVKLTSYLFRLIAQFYTLNLIIFYFDGNIDKYRPSLANYLLLFCPSQIQEKNGICIAV